MNDYSLSSNDPLVQLIRTKGILTWFALIEFLKQTPYGRNSNRLNTELVITENKGTCSSKHALLKKVADLHNETEYQLMIGMYKMNASNTPKIGNVLSKHNLQYIPEAHCYIRYKHQVIDVTNESSTYESIKNEVIVEKIIRPDQTGNYKIAFHQNFIQNWIIEEGIHFSFEKIWKIREECIRNISL